MKKFITSLCALVVACLFSFSAQAQYAKGDITANAGISLGVFGYGAYGAFGSNFSGFLPLSVAVEYSITDDFALGGYAGYYSRSYKYTVGGDTYRNRWSTYSFGVRGSYHATPLLNDLLDTNIDEEKWDIYGTVLLGYDAYSYTWGDSQFRGDYNYGSGDIDFGTVLGTRYFFNPKFGAFAELGRGTFGVLTLGVTGKF
jgi:hypothetical protein